MLTLTQAAQKKAAGFTHMVVGVEDYKLENGQVITPAGHVLSFHKNEQEAIKKCNKATACKHRVFKL